MCSSGNNGVWGLLISNPVGLAFIISSFSFVSSAVKSAAVVSSKYFTSRYARRVFIWSSVKPVITLMDLTNVSKSNFTYIGFTLQYNLYL